VLGVSQRERVGVGQLFQDHPHHVFALILGKQVYLPEAYPTIENPQCRAAKAKSGCDRWPVAGLWQIEAIPVTQLRPGGHKTVDEALLRVTAGIDAGKGTELGIGNWELEPKTRSTWVPVYLSLALLLSRPSRPPWWATSATAPCFRTG